MNDSQTPPGQWHEFDRNEYKRLLSLARYRLGQNYHHLADDVVMRTLIKWRQLSPESKARARIEQVIKTEALSVIRSERRLKAREIRAGEDRALAPSQRPSDSTDRNSAELRVLIAHACKKHRIQLTALELEIYEFLNAGLSLSEIERQLHLRRHKVRQIKERWQLVLTLALSDALDRGSETKQETE